MSKAPGKLAPCLIGGFVPALIMSIPYLGSAAGLLFCCCCLPMFIPGAFGSFLYSRRSGAAGAAFGPSHGALIGMFSGLVFWVSSVFLSLLKKVVGLGPSLEEIAEAQDQAREAFRMLIDQGFLTEETADAALRATSGTGGEIISAAVLLVLVAVCSPIGGTIVGIIARRDPHPS